MLAGIIKNNKEEGENRDGKTRNNKAHSSPTDFTSDGVSCARKDELEQLSGINEAAVIKADSDDVVNQLRNLFNVEI